MKLLVLRSVLLIYICMVIIVFPAGEPREVYVKTTQPIMHKPPERLPSLVSRGAVRDAEREITIKVLNKFLKNKLENKGSVIYDSCKSQIPKVSAKIMTSIILVEVGTDCNSDVLNYADNVGGLNWFEDCGYPKYGRWYIDFRNHGGIDKSIEMKAKTLSNYIKEGRTDIKSIGLKYAPPDDPRNGIEDMDNISWSDNVEFWYSKLNDEYNKLR